MAGTKRWPPVRAASLHGMTSKHFRFALQAVPQDGNQWLGLARLAEELGYSALLMPDGPQLPSPLPSLALAAGATTSLRVGTFVLASLLRPPRLAAWDAHTLSMLTGGRFEFGIGTGQPEVIEQSAQLTGRPPPGAGERLAMVERTIDELRALDGDLHTPVLMAAGGPRALAVAAAKADIVTLATGPLASREEVARLTAQIRQAGDRGSEIEFATPIFVVGDEAPPWVARFLQADVSTMIAHDSLQLLRGSPREMADELERRRETLGISYFSVNAAFGSQFAPVVELLAGH
jgi:alkanesulfonate monooxygenase SsuD/methylene tetrahydromethanopterin reductase-like flavin-dependent oxidoreductase (luciferase family)